MKPFSIRTALKRGTSLVLDHIGFLTIANLVEIVAFNWTNARSWISLLINGATWHDTFCYSRYLFGNNF